MLKRWLLVALSVFIGLNMAYGAWSDDIRITNDAANSYRPSIDIDSKDNLHVIWIENNGVYYTKLAPGGATLVAPKIIAPFYLLLTTSLEDYMKVRGRPTISIDSDDNVVVAYLSISDYDEGTPPEFSSRHVGYLKLDNNGNVIASKWNVESGYATGDTIISYNPDITVNSTNHALIVWEGYTSHYIQPRDRELYYAEFDENGNMIDGPKRLTEDGVSFIVNAYPSVDTDYLDRNHFMSGAGSNIAYTVMTKDGIKLKDNLIIPGSSGGQWVDVAADSQNIHAVWWDMLKNQLYYTKRDVDGNTIVFPKAILSMSPTNMGRPEMDIGPASYIDNIHLALDFSTLSDTNSLFYMLLDNSGSTKISETKFVTSGENPGKNPWGPDIAVDSKNCAHIVWVDQRDGNEEIYYISSCPVPIPPEGHLDFGDAPESYSTLLKDNGARHNITEGIHLGQLIDDEQDGQPTDQDDINGVDDEDGVSFLTPLKIGTTANIGVDASVAGKLNAWVDFNRDGDWADAGEQIFDDKDVIAGLNALAFDVPSGAINGSSYSRFRFDTAGGLSFEGPAEDGEVEDYPVTIEDGGVKRIWDFGDAPESYSTLLKDNGARHNITEGIHLGQLIDDEKDGQPTDQDDLKGVDDEDGVSFLTPLKIGAIANISVDASVAGKLNAWVDFNRDGDWADAGEQIFADKDLTAVLNSVAFNVPSSAVVGSTYSRFRFNTAGGLSFEGAADDGEVEDYIIEIRPRDEPPTPPEPEPVESDPDRNFDSLEVGSDSAIAMNSAIGPRLKTMATNNLEIKKNQDSGACPDECCDPWIKSVGPDGTVESHGCKDCCIKYNRDAIKVGNRGAFTFGSASATNNVKVIADQK